MYSFNSLLTFSLTILCLITFGQCQDEAEVSEEIVVKPGGEIHSHDLTFEDVTCTFSYSCKGGTHEKWKLSMAKASEEHAVYRCSVERPSGTSYLIFQQYTLKINDCQAIHSEAFGNDGKVIEEDQYEKDQSKGLITKLDTNDSELSKLVLYVVKVKEEL